MLRKEDKEKANVLTVLSIPYLLPRISSSRTFWTRNCICHD